jgi:hypothetical protein
MAQADIDSAVLDAQPGDAKSSADDLLSKLAGDEIDRLLAEAETGQSSPAAPPPAADDLNLKTSDAASSAGAGADTDAQIDDLLAALENNPDGQSKAASESAEAPAAPASTETTSTQTTSTAADEEARLKTLSADLELDPPAAATIAAATADTAANATESTLELGKDAFAAPASQSDSPSREPEPSLLVRLLLWINSPVAHAGDSVRGLLGGAAIVTLFNAAAVLIYLTMFRKTH